VEWTIAVARPLPLASARAARGKAPLRTPTSIMSSLLIVGSTALDSIKTPRTEKPRLLGGSASYAAVAASLFAPVKLVGIVGDDFPKRYISLFKRRSIDLEGLQIRPGKTFHWAGEYELNMNNRRTLTTELGVFETFSPDLPPSYRAAPYVLLANISPDLQHHVLDQMRRPRFVVADTMDLWINIALPSLLRLLKRVDCFILNDSEAHAITRADNVFLAIRQLHKLGPRFIIVKLGSHGAILSGPRGIFLCPALPLTKVLDPTGAGDSFVGALMGYLANSQGDPGENLRRAMVYGAVVAAYCCEGFGLTRVARVTRPDVEKRVGELELMTRF
jgi:sugar/nucleoside kinase (ribokinase family)